MLWPTYIKGRLSNIHFKGIKPDIFIVSTARSGSTFLMELLFRQKRVKIFDEPLNVNYPVVRRELDCNTWKNASLIPNRKEVYKKYFERLRNNKIPELNIPIYRKFNRFITDRNIFKVLHGAEDMVKWLQDEFNAHILILVRHPIPTALSHKQFQRLPYFLKLPEYKALFSDKQIEYTEKVIKNGNHFEKGIVNWCLQNRPVLLNQPENSWTLINYEDLTVFPEETFEYMRNKLDLDRIDNINQLAKMPSGSTVQSENETKQFFENNNYNSDRNFLIKKWKQKKSSIDEEKVFDILKLFDIDMYEFGNFFPADNYRISALNKN